MRRKINLIKKLKDRNGNWVEDKADLPQHICAYFQQLFATEAVDMSDEVIQKVNPCVTQAMNDALCAPYTREEVKRALFSIGDLKAPEPDDWNDTTIVLILKVDNPEECCRLSEIWKNLGVHASISELCVDNTGMGVLETILKKQDVSFTHLPGVGLKEMIATACWYMWWERRKIAREEAVQTPARSAQAIAAIVTNYVRSVKNPKIRRHGWEKPREGFVKLNIDAAFNLETETGATGAVLRDNNGMFIAASSCGIAHVADASWAEARALRDGLILAGQTGCNQVLVNSDCMDVVETMNEGGRSSSPAAAVYEDCMF
ncbi:uncharacterized protein [Aegilops tauschii subsp. strangulata]|uniref:uncharacterized protein n=1 Tax=Aegilops tauschii subsp. strangulata TaxID=200361 RepID=UPI00098A754E